MKKRWKIFILIAGITVGIGIILLGTGVMLGANFGDLPAPYFERIHDRGQRDNERNGEEQQEVHYDNVKSLECEIKAADVNVVHYEGSGIKVVSDPELKTKYQYDEASQSLKIITNTRFRNVNGLQLSIYVPDNLRFEEVDFSLGAGVMSVDTISAKDLNVEIGAGEAVIDEFDVDDLRISCGAGSLILTTQEKLQDYNYDVTCDIGSVSIGDNDFTGLGSTKEMNYNANKDIKIECGVGEVAMYFKE